MPLTDEILRRLAAIGITSDADLKYWRDLGDSPRVSDAVFLLHLRTHEADGAEYRRLLPALRAFLAGRRSASPVPTEPEMSPVEREQSRILGDAIRQFAASADGGTFSRRTPNRAVLFVTSRPGLAAALEAFAGTDVDCLTDAEWDRWKAGPGRSDEDGIDGEPGWYRIAHWLISRRAGGPEGEGWLLRQLCWYGSLAASGQESYWSWDGTRPRFLYDGSHWIA